MVSKNAPLALTIAALALATSCASTRTIDKDKTLEAAKTEIEGAPAFSDVPDAADASPEAEADTLTSTIKKVTVYSDRALVTRQATVEVAGEAKIYAFSNLPGWVDDGSVRVSVSAGRIIDVRVQRNFLARATDATYKAAEDHHKDLTQQIAALDDEIRVLDAQKAQIEAIKAFSLEKITQDTTIGNITVESYSQVVDFISGSLRKTAAARREVHRARAEITPEYQASQRNLNELRNLMQLEETTVMVTLAASQPTPSTIELTYMMPGATWQPLHELRVSTKDNKTVEVTSFAVVTQTSGEDWGNAELSFATQSSTQSVLIPELEALTLGDTQTATRILTSKVSSFSRAEQAFKGQSSLWNKVHQSKTRKQHNFEEVFQSNVELLQTVQSKTVEIFENLQKRGTTALFEAKNPKSVRGDGHPVRLRIGRTTLSSTQKLVAAPETSLNAARTLEMVNSSGQALLPGKVALYQDGAFLGMTELGFIAEGERFSLFLSVADHLKITRKLDRKKSALIRKKRSRLAVSFIVTVENLSDSPTTLTLADRIPVSENKDIKVDNIKITPATKPDTKGLLKWEVTLAPKEKQVFRIAYQIEYPPTLIVETTRKRRAAPARRPGAGAPEPSQRQEYQIDEQIMDLEIELQ